MHVDKAGNDEVERTGHKVLRELGNGKRTIKLLLKSDKNEMSAHIYYERVIFSTVFDSESQANGSISICLPTQCIWYFEFEKYEKMLKM